MIEQPTKGLPKTYFYLYLEGCLITPPTLDAATVLCQCIGANGVDRIRHHIQGKLESLPHVWSALCVKFVYIDCCYPSLTEDLLPKAVEITLNMTLIRADKGHMTVVSTAVD